MEKRRRRAERKRLEEVEQHEHKRCEDENDLWRATLERESESRRSFGQGLTKDYSAEHSSLPDRLLHPDLTRTRSSSVVVEPRPAFQRSRSGSVANIVDPIKADATVPRSQTLSARPQLSMPAPSAAVPVVNQGIASKDWA